MLSFCVAAAHEPTGYRAGVVRAGVVGAGVVGAGVVGAGVARAGVSASYVSYEYMQSVSMARGQRGQARGSVLFPGGVGETVTKVRWKSSLRRYYILSSYTRFD